MRMIYLQLYLSFLQVGLFSVGGGYAAMPLIRSQVVELHPWMTLQEFTNLITIAEMTPGPIAVNCATFVGLRIAQLPGAVIATLGCITPCNFNYKTRAVKEKPRAVYAGGGVAAGTGLSARHRKGRKTRKTAKSENSTAGEK